MSGREDACRSSLDSDQWLFKICHVSPSPLPHLDNLGPSLVISCLTLGSLELASEDFCFGISPKLTLEILPITRISEKKKM